MTCKAYEDARWFCEDHPDRPWNDHPDACRCGGAGMPCPVCNEPKEGEQPAVPADFIPQLDRDKGPIR
jgi:hypothetical protein